MVIYFSAGYQFVGNLMSVETSREGGKQRGSMVKRLRHRPFTAVTRVRFPLESFLQKAEHIIEDRIRRSSQAVRRGSATP